MTVEPVQTDADAAYAEFVGEMQIQAMSLAECSAVRHLATVPDGDFDLEIEPGFRLEGNQVSFRFVAECHPTDEDGDTVADLRVVYIATFGGHRELGEEDLQLIERYLNDVALMAVYPYVREGLQSLAQRLELPPLTLGILRRGEMAFRNAVPLADDE